MNSKPEWFKCENCMWWELTESSYRPETGFCHQSNLCMNKEHAEPGKDWYCDHWTCRRCWQGWNQIIFEGSDMVMYPQGRPWHVKDHTKCAPVRFKGEE